MNSDEIQIIHEAASEAAQHAREGNEADAVRCWVEAANLALEADGLDDRVRDKDEAIEVLQTLEANLSDQERYLDVAVLLWGNAMFDSRPSPVRQVFSEVMKNSKLLIMGASSLSKTFSCGVLYYLFWREDPYWTAVKLAAPNADHLYTNLFSHLVALHKGAVIPMRTEGRGTVEINETDMFIAMKDALPEMRIQGILCRQSDISAGAMRGHKAKPYRKPDHPKWGNSTRLFILIDEATQVSPGAFEDIKTTEASISDTMNNIKITIAFNPDDVAKKVVQMAEPFEGWDISQIDTLYSWTSKKGYPVLRLDGKRFENVVERTEIYPRMMTYSAYLGFLSAGEHSAAYWSKGRGFPPLSDNAHTIVPPSWVSGQRGDPIYVGTVTTIAVLDTALGGGDKALLGIGRWGEAAGWTDHKGETHWFVNRADIAQRITKHVAVLDQIIGIEKSTSSVDIIGDVMGRCNQMKIAPENVGMDKGGNASGVWSHAVRYWGDVLGIDAGVRASENKILSDDQMVAYDVYDRKASELWFAMKRWLDPVVCAVLLGPTLPMSPIFSQLTTRRYRQVRGGKLQVEPKHEYRARNGGVSPDEADILVFLVEWCRQRGGYVPGIMEAKAPVDPDRTPISVQTVDLPDTLETSPSWTPNRLSADE